MLGFLVPFDWYPFGYKVPGTEGLGFSSGGLWLSRLEIFGQMVAAGLSIWIFICF